MEETPVPGAQVFAGWRLPEEGSEARFPGQAGACLTVQHLLRQSSALGSEQHPSCRQLRLSLQSKTDGVGVGAQRSQQSSPLTWPSVHLQLRCSGHRTKIQVPAFAPRGAALLASPWRV